MGKNEKKVVRIIHKPSGDILAEGPRGWDMFSFKGNYYVADKHIKTDGFSSSWIPGLCV